MTSFFPHSSILIPLSFALTKDEPHFIQCSDRP